MWKNIIHITGNDSYGVELELKRWLGAFRMKFWDINIDRYDLSDTSNLKWIGDMILMGGLFAEKRLFIFRWGRERKSKAAGLEIMLTEKLEQIPEDHFLLFHNIWEKEEWLIAWLSKNADTRKINTLWDEKSWEGRSDIDLSIISLVLDTYQKEEKHREKDDINQFLGHDIAHTIEMISLIKSNGEKLQKDDIINLCHGYSGSNTFALIDAITNIDAKLSITLCHRIASIYPDGKWIGWIIAALSNNLSVKYLKHHGYKEYEIAQIIKIHPFALKKAYWSMISYQKLKKIYEKLVSINIAYKTGKWLKDSELWRILSIELALLDLQKSKNL